MAISFKIITLILSGMNLAYAKTNCPSDQWIDLQDVGLGNKYSYF